MNIIKRSGKKEKFNPEKIKTAIKAAFKSTGYTIDEDVYDEIVNSVKVWNDMNIEDIQDQVIETLRNFDYGEVADCYLIYRYKHQQARLLVEAKKNFIKKYKEASNTANATIDDNSNVANKNIGILNAEGHKEENILISRAMITDKLKELFPDFDSKQYVKDLENHIIYKHDESSFMGAIAPYTYSPKETVEVIYGKNHWLVALDTLYDLIDTEEILEDSENEVYCKYPEELYIKDKDKTTLVTRLVRKRRHRNLVRVKTSFGEDIIVTDNHPLIISDNIDETVEAKSAEEKTQLRCNPNIVFDNRKNIDLSAIVGYTTRYSNYFLQQDKSYTAYFSCKRNIEFTEDFGYVVGFFIGDGHYNNSKYCLSFTQKDKQVLEKISEIFYDIAGISSLLEYKKDKTNCWRLHVNSKAMFDLFKHYFKIKDYAQNKNLPVNLLEFTPEFAKGIIEGLIDSDGTIQNNGSGVLLRLSSRECINQVTTLLRYFNCGVSNTIQNTPFSNNSEYKTNYTIWGVSFSNTVGCTKFNNSFKWKELINREISKSIKYKEGWVKIDSISDLEESAFLQQCDYIYDITTESHTFLTSNILVHNCCSISMYPFFNNGIKGLGGLSACPKNLDSFCGIFINLVFAISGQFAGAIATPEFLMYFDYFARKEWGNSYYEKADVIISSEHELRKMTIRSQIRQHFQQVVYSINQPTAARGMQSAFWNVAYFDKPFFEAMFENFLFPDMTAPQWESLCWLQKEFMLWFNEERLKTILTFPVESFALIYKDGQFVDKENADFVAKEYARGHSFFTYISDTADSLSSCCRLKNKVNTKEFNFTNGNMGVETGSKSVITLNLNRIIQDCARKHQYCMLPENMSQGISIHGRFLTYLKEDLENILYKIYKYHIAYNECLWDMYDAGLLPAYKEGFISLNKQYLTIGLNGLNQSAEFLGIKCRHYDKDYKQFCQFIFGTIKEANTNANGTYFGHKVTFNTEMVPAESLAIKNYNWDKQDKYWVPEDTNLYASYIFKPNSTETSVLEKMILHGKDYIGDYLDGGSAAHINLAEHLSKEQYKKLLVFAAENGCQYFTFNIPNCECGECGFIAKQPFDKCPKCGSAKVYLWDRIIGYLTKIKNWSEGRQIEQKTRVYSKSIK